MKEKIILRITGKKEKNVLFKIMWRSGEVHQKREGMCMR